MKLLNREEKERLKACWLLHSLKELVELFGMTNKELHEFGRVSNLPDKKGRFWSDDIEYLRDNIDRLSILDLLIKFRCSEPTLYKQLSRMGIHSKKTVKHYRHKR